MKTTAFVIVFALCLQLASAAHSDDCHDLDSLINNIDSTILGMCNETAVCTQVTCGDSPFEVLGNTVVTVLPCALPQPSLNFLVLGETGIVLGNFTTFSEESNQVVRVTLGGGAFLPLFSLDWVVQYNEPDETILVQVNGTALYTNGTSAGPPGSVINATTIPLNRTECAGGAPGMRFMISAVLLSLLIALLAN